MGTLLDRLLGQVRFQRSVFERKTVAIKPGFTDGMKVSSLTDDEYLDYLDRISKETNAERAAALLRELRYRMQRKDMDLQPGGSPSDWRCRELTHGFSGRGMNI